MEYARIGRYVVLTEDLEFGSMLAMSNEPGPSVVQLRLQDARPAVLGSHITIVLRQMETQLLHGALVTVDPERSRVRMLPLWPIE